MLLSNATAQFLAVDQLGFQSAGPTSEENLHKKSSNQRIARQLCIFIGSLTKVAYVRLYHNWKCLGFNSLGAQLHLTLKSIISTGRLYNNGLMA